MSTFTRLLAKGAAVASKHAPTGMLVGGIAAMAAAVFVACEATTTASYITEEFEQEMQKIEDAKELASQNKAVYTPENERKDLAIVYSKTCVKFFKHYWKAISLFAVGAALVVGGHGILSKRNVALIAAYSGLDKTFKDYRSNIVSKYGEDIDYGALHGFETETVGMVDEDGVVTEVESKPINPDKKSFYSILWDDMYSTEWTPNPSTNKLILEAKEKYWTDVLRTRGYVHLDEVYRDLGVWGRIGDDLMKAATAVGWVYGCGDDYVSFGIRDNIVHNTAKADFQNGLEPSILLDFNIDGIIHDLL